MKIRQGFVSNSSSSSFIVLTEGLENYQIDQIRDPQFVEWWYKKNGTNDPRWGLDHERYGLCEPWEVENRQTYLFLDTHMNNMNFPLFLKEIINIPEDHIYCVYEEYSEEIDDVEAFVKEKTREFRINKINRIKNFPDFK